MDPRDPSSTVSPAAPKSLSLSFIEIAQGRGLPITGIQDLDGVGDSGLDVLLDLPGIRTVYAELFYHPRNTVVVPPKRCKCYSSFC